jgi:fatty acid desaturase
MYAACILVIYCSYLFELRATRIDYDEEANPIIALNILLASIGLLTIATLTLIYQRAWYKRYYFTPLIIPLSVAFWLIYVIFK